MLQGDRVFRQQMSDRPDDGRGNLFGPTGGPGAVTGSFGADSKPMSLSTRTLERHPALKPLLAGAALLGAVALVRGLGRPGRRPHGLADAWRDGADAALERLS
jgi:hypothetical protein